MCWSYVFIVFVNCQFPVYKYIQNWLISQPNSGCQCEVTEVSKVTEVQESGRDVVVKIVSKQSPLSQTLTKWSQEAFLEEPLWT
jgi:uncharacterized Fe-S radical SAM superfamily protein PflX